MELKQTEYELKEGIALIRLNRPGKLNALTPVMREELIHLFQLADQDDAVRVVVITGTAWAALPRPTSRPAVPPSTSPPEKPGMPMSDHRDGGGRWPWPVLSAASR